jgi:hypothetical protein
MSDENAPQGENGGNNDGWTPPASQEELNRIIAERINREKAKYADYSDLKAKASEFDKLSEASKSELQRATERAEQAERERDQVRSESLRLSVIAKHQIPADYHEFVVGGSEDELEAKAQKVLTLIASNKPDPFPKPDPSQGPKGAGKTSTADLFAHQLEQAGF